MAEGEQHTCAGLLWVVTSPTAYAVSTRRAVEARRVVGPRL